VIALSQLNSHRRGGGRFVVAVVAALAAAPAAFAADVLTPTPAYTKAPAPIANDWTGFYLGAGVGSRSSQVDGDVPPTSISIANNFLSNCGPFRACRGESVNDTAFRVSPYFGYNYQFAPQWLAGIEGDVGLGSKTATLVGVFGPNSGVSSFDGTESFAVKTDWDASVRGRLGFLVTPSFLLYATGGAAWQHIEATSTCSMGINATCGIENGIGGGGVTPSVIVDSTTKLGYTIGAGIETMLWRNWIVRGEYRYADFGTVTSTDTRCSSSCSNFRLIVTDSLRLRTQTATFGIAYKFGP
jgi:outer membrane immunogenic protein